MSDGRRRRRRRRRSGVGPTIDGGLSADGEVVLSPSILNEDEGTNVVNAGGAQNSSSGRKSQPTGDEALPRPLKHLNAHAARAGHAERYGTASTEFPPAPTVP